MNPKIEKMKAELEKNTSKITKLQERNKKLTEQVIKLENIDIIGIVREIGLTPDELAQLLGGSPIPAVVPAARVNQDAEAYADEDA